MAAFLKFAFKVAMYFSAISGLILLALGLGGLETGRIPWYGWTILLLAIAIASAQLDGWSLREEKRRVDRDLQAYREAEPILELSDPVRNIEQWGPQRVPGPLYRLRVTNTGGTAAERVEVGVTSSDPAIRNGLYTWLHQTDDNENCFLRTFDLPVGEEVGKTLDTFYSIDAEGWQLRLYHAVSGCDSRLPRQHYVVRITASAINARKPASRWYEVDFDERADLMMRAIPEPLPNPAGANEAEQQIEA